MKNFKSFLLIIFFNILLITNLNSKEVPDSFADLVEKLTPSSLSYRILYYPTHQYTYVLHRLFREPMVNSKHPINLSI